jgi:ribosome recycling factor
MSTEFSEKNYSLKMDKSIQSLKKDISTLRTGRANINMLDTVKVDVYGQLMPINQLATVSVPEARMITIQVWDKNNLNIIESAIQKSELGINPQVDGQLIRLRIPDLTEERRKDLIKILKNMCEKGKIAVRNIRREANEELKKKLKDNIQKITDSNIVNIDKILSEKEIEISQI